MQRAHLKGSSPLAFPDSTASRAACCRSLARVSRTSQPGTSPRLKDVAARRSACLKGNPLAAVGPRQAQSPELGLRQGAEPTAASSACLACLAYLTEVWRLGYIYSYVLGRATTTPQSQPRQHGRFSRQTPRAFLAASIIIWNHTEWL
jgi:hypothetical protein